MKLLDCTCTEEFMQWSIVYATTEISIGIDDLMGLLRTEDSVTPAQVDDWIASNLEWLFDCLDIYYSGKYYIHFTIAGYYWFFENGDATFNLLDRYIEKTL